MFDIDDLRSFVEVAQAGGVSSAAMRLPVLTQHPVPQAGLYVVRPPGAYPSRKVKALIDVMVAASGDARPLATAIAVGEYLGPSA